jgi:hypothetical protein
MKNMAEEVARLADLTREALIDLWVSTHGYPPPKGISANALETVVLTGLSDRLRDEGWLVEAIGLKESGPAAMRQARIARPKLRLP